MSQVNSVSRLPQPRTVQVYHNQGQATLTPIETDAATWGQLQHDMQARGMDFNPRTQIATESVGFTSLVLPEALLPTGSFTLAVNVRDTKGGHLSRQANALIEKAVSDLRESLARLFTAYENAHMSEAGKEAKSLYERMRSVTSGEGDPEPFEGFREMLDEDAQETFEP